MLIISFLSIFSRCAFQTIVSSRRKSYIASSPINYILKAVRVKKSSIGLTWQQHYSSRQRKKMNRSREGDDKRCPKVVVDSRIAHIGYATKNLFALQSILFSDIFVFHILTKVFPILNLLNGFFARHICVGTLYLYVSIFWLCVKFRQPTVSRNVSFNQILTESLCCNPWFGEDDIVSVVFGVRLLVFAQWLYLPFVCRIAGANYDVFQPQYLIVEHWQGTHNFHTGQCSISTRKLVVLLSAFFFFPIGTKCHALPAIVNGMVQRVVWPLCLRWLYE